MCSCASVEQLERERGLSCRCVCVCARLLCGLGCKRAVRTHLADKQAAGWLGNRREFVCVCVFVFMWVSDRKKGKEKRKRAQKQAAEVKFA